MGTIRYWVGGTNTYDATAGTKWSASSGGAGGASAPTDTSTVYFDAASGAAIVTLDSSLAFQHLDCSGFTGQFIGTGSVAPTSASASIKIDSGMTWTHNGTFSFLSADLTVECGGGTIGATINFGTGAALTFDLIDTFSSTGSVLINRATFNTNNFNMKCAKFLTTNTGASPNVINMGSSVVEITGSGLCLDILDVNTTFNGGTSTFKLTNNSATSKTIRASGITFNKIWLATAGTGYVTFAAQGFSNTGFDMNQFKIDAGVVFAQPTTYQYNINTSFVGQGASGNKIKFHSATNGVQTGTLNAVLGCTVSADHMIIQDSLVTDSAGGIWIATHSTDAGNNTGWTFTPPTLDHFLLEKIGGGNIPTQLQNVAFNIKISAIDDGGDVFPGFVSTADITSTGTISGGPFTTGAFVAGILASQSLAITNTGTFTITATDSGGPTTGTSNAFAVTVPGTGVNTNTKPR